MNFSEEMARFDDEWRTRRRRIDALVSDPCLTNGAFLTGYKIAYYHALAHDSAEFQASYQKSMEEMMYLHSRVCMQPQAIAELHLHRDHSDAATWQAYPGDAAPLIRDLQNLIEQLRVHAAALRPHVPKKHHPAMDEPFERFSTLALSLVEALEEASAFAGEIEGLQTRGVPIEKAVKPGYKQTEVGVIPEEWEVIPLSKTAKRITRGASPRPIDSPVWFDARSSVGWVRISDVTRSGRYLLETTQRLSEAGIRSSRPVPSGSLIMSICATVGRPIETRIDTCIHDGFVVFDQPTIEQSFLYHTLTALEPTWSKHGQTGSQMNLNTGLINGCLIPLPPSLPEQRAIAKALSDVDGLLGGLDRLIAKKRDLKQAAMQQLLTGQTRLPGFHGEWVEKSLDQVSTLKGRIGWQGLKQTEFTWIADQPFLITGMNFKDGAIRWDEVYHISEDRYEIAKDIQLKVGDVLMTKDGTIGKILFVDHIPFPGKASLNSHLLLFRPIGRAYDPIFLYFQLNSKRFKDFIELNKSGTTFFGISQSAVAEYQVLLPPLPEQTAIAEVLSEMDGELAVLEQRREKTRALKQAMMQELLTGRTRLV